MKNCGKLRENAGGGDAGKERCRNQTPRSLEEQRVCTGDTQGTNTHARGTREKQLRKSRRKLWGIAKNYGPQSPPPYG